MIIAVALNAVNDLNTWRLMLATLDTLFRLWFRGIFCLSNYTCRGQSGLGWNGRRQTNENYQQHTLTDHLLRPKSSVPPHSSSLLALAQNDPSLRLIFADSFGSRSDSSEDELSSDDLDLIDNGELGGGGVFLTVVSSFLTFLTYFLFFLTS